MLVLDNEGKIFDERRKNERRKKEDQMIIGERRREDRRVEDINKNPKIK